MYYCTCRMESFLTKFTAGEHFADENKAHLIEEKFCTLLVDKNAHASVEILELKLLCTIIYKVNLLCK